MHFQRDRHLHPGRRAHCRFAGESSVSNIVLENVHITAETGMTILNAKGIRFTNSAISVKQGPPFSVENAEVDGLENPKK